MLCIVLAQAVSSPGKDIPRHCLPTRGGGEAVGGRAAGEEAREEEEGKHAYVTVGRFTVSAPWSR